MTLAGPPPCSLPLLACLSLLAASCRPADPEAGSPRPASSAVDELGSSDEGLAPDFSLTDQHGRRFRLRDERGKVVLLFFGYTRCPDVCPATLSSWAMIEDELGDSSSQVTFAFITVDRERDSAKRLGKHLSVFSDAFLGLRGTQEELDVVYEAYQVYPERVPISQGELGYVVDHPTRMFLIDRRGELRRRHDYRKYPPDIAREVKWYLDRPESAETP